MIVLRWPSHFQARSTEWMLATIKFGWGMSLLLPYQSMIGNPAMAGMLDIWPQRTWGTLAFIAGGLHLMALWINGTYHKSPHIRMLCSVVGMAFWMQVCRGLFASGVPNQGWWVYSVFVVFSMTNVIRAAQDARLSDDRAREAKGLMGGRC